MEPCNTFQVHPQERPEVVSREKERVPQIALTIGIAVEVLFAGKVDLQNLVLYVAFAMGKASSLDLSADFCKSAFHGYELQRAPV